MLNFTARTGSRPQALRMRQGALKAHLLTCGGTLALIAACALAAPTFAQTTPAAAAPAGEDGTTVVITGIRKGIQDAITAKKKSPQIVEAVSAEDIGKLPDASIAESIARLPGIAAQRTNGRAQTLSVRGLGPDFTVTTLNGREQVSTNDNRSVEFDQYPSELISQVLVYKTPNAGMVTQGIAGTADLQTVRPLAYGKRAMAFNIRGEKNSEDAAIAGTKNTGSRYSATYINQFANKTIGLALGYAHTDSPYQVAKKESWGYPNLNSTTLVIGGEKDAIVAGSFKRDGYMGVLEFKPTDQLHMTFDAYHSTFDELQKIARLEYPLYWSSAALQPGYTTGNGFVTHGVFTGVNTVVENYVNRRKATVDAVGWNTEYQLNDQWDLMSDVSYSKVSRDDVILESTAGTGASGSGPKDTITFDQSGYGIATLKGVLNYSDFNSVYLTDPGGWGGPVNRAGYVKSPHIEDELTAVKLAATRKLSGGLFSQVTFGMNSADRKKNKVGIEGYLSLNGTAAQVVVPAQYRTGTTDATFLGSTSGMISYDALGLFNSGFFKFTEETGTGAVQKTWNIEEKITTLFVKADIDSTFMGVPVTGNVGLQSQSADQKAESYYTDGTATGLTLIKNGAKYSDILPSLSLNFALSDSMTLRFGAATTLSRPRLDDLSSGTGFGVTTDGGVPSQFNGHAVYWSGGGGNSALKPWKANGFDVSFERYFGRKGYISAAVFHKDLTTYIFSQTIAKDYTGVALPAYCTVTTIPHNVCTLAAANRMGTSTAQANGKGGSIDGLELTASVPGELVSPWLDGFGLIWSGSFNQSAVNPSGTNKIDLPGLSRQVINTTVYYEKYGFSARLSNRYRAAFLGEVPDYTNSLQNTWVHEESVFDAQLGYAFPDGPLKGLSISLSATNLTNEPFSTYQGKDHPEQTIRYEKYGSTYLFGINYKY